jgi:hypothetical protein
MLEGDIRLRLVVRRFFDNSFDFGSAGQWFVLTLKSSAYGSLP